MMRVLAATDFSEESRPVLDYAANLVRQCGGKMYLLHAVEPCVIDAAGSLSACDIPEGIPGIELPRVGIGCEVLEMADNRAKQLAEEISKKWDIPIYGKAEEADDIVECMSSFCKSGGYDVSKGRGMPFISILHCSSVSGQESFSVFPLSFFLSSSVILLALPL